MKSYPEIPGPSKGQHKPCYGFVKYDGSNIRAEWNKKQGWYKFGTRKMMIDERSETFGAAIPLFLEKYGEALPLIFKKEKFFFGVQSVIVFFEWYSANSFAGQHTNPNDKYNVVLFDVNPHKKGFIGPKQFVDMFGHTEIAELVYRGNFNQELIEDVKNENLNIESEFTIRPEIPEGIICKGAESNPHRQWMCKIKTKRYLDKLKAMFTENWTKFGEE